MQFKKVILIKPGEIALKGLNKGSFESQLIKNIKQALVPCGKFEILNSQSTFTIRACNLDSNLNQALCEIKNVFGISKFAIANLCCKDLDEIKECCLSLLHEHGAFKSFKVEAKRADKTFFPNSTQLCPIIGELVLAHFEGTRVDLHNPEVCLKIEVRQLGAYVYIDESLGAGGLPVGCCGGASVLLSGGIDSPVAAYMMAKRGMKISCVHFASPPYTSELARLKVQKLASLLEKYCGKIRFHCVEFTRIQEAIKNLCPCELSTVIMRRFMFRVAQELALKDGFGALVTGESLGQVASQTLEAIACTNEVCYLPVFRPLIGMDKIEIIEKARAIGSFETSILPYEDCCTIFTPKHPKTKPSLESVVQCESKLAGVILDEAGKLILGSYEVMRGDI